MDGVDVYELEYPTYEGVRLAKVEPLLRDAGKVINDIQDLKLGPEAVILATFPRSGAIYGGWFQYNQAFIREAKARKDQIIMLQYETLKNNTLKELKRLAEFLEVKIADPLLKEIAEKCQFDNLKTADKSVRNDEALSKIMRAVSLNEHPTIYRKGEIGDWKNYFTVAMSEAFDKTNADNMDDIGLEFEFE
ncbi:sulfotransferase 1B1-like isoform X2 [Magallana gigas]|uniref:sulfotransferase 1B1-like isoform X2 n=1 Tax=Magallana gigas TaxID=29159 RepID=UPI003341D28E